MTKRILIFLLTICCILSFSSCGNKKDSTTKQTTECSTESTPSTASDASSTDSLEAIGNVDVDENLIDVTITIPSDIIGEVTQEELDESTKNKGYKSATLNEDGSVTYVMTKKQHKELLSVISEEIDKGTSELVGSDILPDVTSITANDNYTLFTITTKNSETSISEVYSVATFYSFGGMYSAFSGEDIDNIHVDFINAESGELIESYDSKDLEESDEEKQNQ